MRGRSLTSKESTQPCGPGGFSFAVDGRCCDGGEMPSLVDPLPPAGQRLVEVVAQGWAAASGRWPVWQYVSMRLHEEGIDATSTLQRLPTWQYHYRPVALSALGSVPDLDQSVALTMHGVIQAGGLVSDVLLPVFLASLRLAAKEQLSVAPDPTRVVPVEVEGGPFTEQVNMAAGAGLSGRQLFETLRREPPCWGGVVEEGSSWRWDLTRQTLSGFADLTTGDAYLSQLETIVGLPVGNVGVVALPPLALLDALDHLDLAWRLTMKQRLVDVPRTILVGRLTQPAGSAEEFESRCTALADVIANFRIPEDESVKDQDGSLNRLPVLLNQMLGDKASLAQAGVKTLRHIVGIRNAQQHTASSHRYEKDRRALGLDKFAGEWSAAWEHLRWVCVVALDNIREALVAHLDQRRGG